EPDTHRGPQKAASKEWSDRAPVNLLPDPGQEVNARCNFQDEDRGYDLGRRQDDRQGSDRQQGKSEARIAAHDGGEEDPHDAISKDEHTHARKATMGPDPDIRL